MGGRQPRDQRVNALKRSGRNFVDHHLAAFTIEEGISPLGEILAALLH
jgi:hypothetical protein